MSSFLVVLETGSRRGLHYEARPSYRGQEATESWTETSVITSNGAFLSRIADSIRQADRGELLDFESVMQSL